MISDSKAYNYKKVLNFETSSRAPSSIGETTSQYQKSMRSKRSKIDKKKLEYFQKVMQGRLDLLNNV